MLSAVGRLYSAAAALSEADWIAALQAVLDAAGFDGAALYVVDKAVLSLQPGEPSPVRGLWHRLNPEGQADYAGHWIKVDPRVDYMLRHPKTRILHDYLHTPEEEIDRHPFYDWYLHSQLDFGRFDGARLLNPL